MHHHHNKHVLISPFTELVQGILFSCGSCLGDPCDNPTDISDERRSVRYQSLDGNYLCDHGMIQEGNWYTFDTHTGGKMPETCPEFYSCGTQAPIWFNDVHPTDSEVHDATVCVNINSCCEIAYDIQVKKCPDEKYIYRLAEPVACDLAYCAGSGLPCEPGKVWVESLEKCSDGYPVMSGPPHLSDPIAPDDLFRGTFQFRCTINYSDNDGRAMFEVYWYFDNEEDPNVGPEQIDGTEAYLDELKLVGHVGKTVSCGARSYWPDHPNTPSDTLISDNGYWVGIKVPAEVNLTESKADTTIELESTVPITCGCCRKTDTQDGFKDQTECQFEIKMNSAPKISNVPSNCIAIFNPSKTRATFTLSPVREYTQRRDLTQVFYQNVKYSADATAIWKDYNIGPSKVHITNDQRMGLCESVTDPHIKSFDRMSNKLPYYHLYQPGKYILVKSTSPRVLEIHSLLRTCELKTTVACNCGVAIREGNLMYGVDNCKGQFRTFKKTLVDGTLNKGTLTTNAAGTTFTIVMPSGAKVVATEDKSWHLNVYVSLPSEFYNTTSGLCGTWDGDATNDFQLQFSDEIVSSSKSQPRKFTDSFRIPKGQSFFETDPCVELLDPEAFHYCRCAGGTSKINCENTGTIEDDPIADEYPNLCANKRKRQVDDFNLIFADLAEEEEDTQPIDLSWPTQSGITEEEAIEKCNDVLQESLAYDLCQNVVTVDTEEIKTICRLDIQIADNLTVAEAMQNVFENTCVEEAHLNVVSGTNDTDDPLTKLVESIASIICINQCSGHGLCNNGTCDCDIEYLGADCSFRKGTAPTIKDVALGGICDTYLGTCHGIKMSADLVISGAVCRFTSIEVSPEGQNRTEGIEPQISESTILSNTKVFCQLPSTNKNPFATYNLALSLDGEVFSKEILVSIFNSVCVDCTSDGFCTIKPDTCAIDGKCYTGSTCTACEEAIDIGHPKRSAAYKTQANETQRCDASHIEEGKWYRFNQYTGNEIPEQCISTGHCGTKNTIWLDGMHPTADVPVTTGITCANYYDEGCCDWSAPVTVKYCRDAVDQPFYAYQLMPPPVCETAFCSGNIMPCGDREEWDEDSEACIDAFPVMSGPPHLSDPIAPEDLFQETFQFKCTINYSDDDARAMFEVRWYFDNEEDPNVGPEQIDRTEAYLDELKLVGHVGKTVSCSAMSYWPDHQNTSSDTLMSDNGYWVGIKVPAEVNLTESEADTTIKLESTVPITCGCCRKTDTQDGFKDQTECQFEIRMNSLPTFRNTPSDCIAVFSPSKTRATFTISPVRKYIKRKDLTQVFYEDVTYNKSDIVTAIWKDYNIGSSKVLITNDQRMGHCKSVTDPHIKSFDRMSNNLPYYHLFQPGKYKLVISTSPRVLEIHSVLRPCELNPNVACNCGVAIREGNLLLGVDNCNGPFRTFKKTLVNEILTDGTLATNTAGTAFTIVMPSGAKVVATEDKHWHLNVDVFLPSEFYNTTSGLCGIWDGDASNDFQLQFSNEIVSSSESLPKVFTDSFRIPKGESFFETNPCVELLDPEAFYYCECVQGEVNCVNTRTITDVAIDNTFSNVCASKRKRQADDFNLIFADLAEEEEDTQPIELTWPTPSGITKDEAIEKCNAVLQESLAYDLCQNVVTVDTEEIKSICRLDIQIADNLTVAEALKNVFENTCIEEARLNVVSGNDDTDDPLITLAESIANIICINQCSGHGLCNNGTCDCDTEYLGADCSFNKGTAPIIQDVAFEGICDTYLGTCNGIKISADVAISGAVCRFTSLEVTPAGQALTDGIEPEITESTILSNTKVFCKLPSTKTDTFATYKLAISLDREVFSEEILVSIFNSVCVDCTSGGLCTLKQDMCDIDGKCHTGSICTACEEAIDIGHPKRSTAYETQANETQLCDALQIEEGKWYRFNQYTGNEIPEQCISTGHCGTKNTIWLDAIHPTADVPVTTGITCANYYDGGCCDWSAPVTVKYCNDDEDQPFHAYQLMPPPSCETAYCSGDIMPCAEGEVWDEMHDMCVTDSDYTTEEGTIVTETGSVHSVTTETTTGIATTGMEQQTVKTKNNVTDTVETTESDYSTLEDGIMTEAISAHSDTTETTASIATTDMEKQIVETKNNVTKPVETTESENGIVTEAFSVHSDTTETTTDIGTTDMDKQTENTNRVSDSVETPESGTNLGLILGVPIAIAGVLAVCTIIVIVVVSTRKAATNKKIQEYPSSMHAVSMRNRQPYMTDPIYGQLHGGRSTRNLMSPRYNHHEDPRLKNGAKNSRRLRRFDF